MLRHQRRTYRRLSLQVLDDRRVLAAIVGSVFHDANDSLRRDAEELGLPSRLVYVDQNNNSRLDATEQYALAGADGSFSIDNMPDGDYTVRLYSGTSSQIQTTPTSAMFLHDAVLRTDVTAAVPAVVLDAGTSSERNAPAVLAAGNSLQTLAADGTLSDPVDLGGEIRSLSRLAGGSVIAFVNTSDGARMIVVDEALSLQSNVAADDSGTLLHSGATDDLGRGVALAQSDVPDATVALWSVDTTAGTLVATNVLVPNDAVLTSDSTPRTTDGLTRSVISYATLADDGNGGTTEALGVSFWNNLTGEVIGDAIEIVGATEVVAFHDEAGLLVLRSGDNLSVHDIDNALATLYSIDDTPGVAAIDAARGLIVTLSPRSFSDVDSTELPGLRLLDSETGSLVADLAIDLSALGDLAAVSLDANLQSVMLTGAAGLAQVSLRKPTAARVSINGGDSAPVSFGVRLIGDNASPGYVAPPIFNAEEDTLLFLPAPGLLAGSTDADVGDEYVVLPAGPATFGNVTISPSGQVTYAPQPDFEGTDSFTVILTDGRDITEAEITIFVAPIADAPTGVNVDIDPVPENILPADGEGEFGVIGVINIEDVDANNNFIIHILDENRVEDNRFQVIGGEIIFLGPDLLDFENEWAIPLIITITDPDANSTIEYATTISVTDADDPITDITPNSASVQENSEGEIFTSLTVDDQDFGQLYTWSVDDERFEVVDGELKLKDGVALDREAAETVLINITASFGSDSFTKSFAVNVLDAPETPADFELDNATVLELEPEDVVGTLTIAGNPGANGHSLTVNDPRFVFEGSVLRLAQNTFIERTPGVDDEILIEITATPLLGGLAGVTQSFVIAVLENDKPFHNDNNPEDVNGDGDVTARDALVIINYLNTYGPGPVGEGDPAFGYDVNNDGLVTSLDALLVINELNATGGGGGTVGNEPEGEPVNKSRPQRGTLVVGTNDRTEATDDTPVVPMTDFGSLSTPVQRLVNRDVAISGLMQSQATKLVITSPSVETVNQAVELLMTESSQPSSADETNTDAIFSDLELLS
jgi:hypothetical protein